LFDIIVYASLGFEQCDGVTLLRAGESRDHTHGPGTSDDDPNFSHLAASSFIARSSPSYHKSARDFSPPMRSGAACARPQMMKMGWWRILPGGVIPAHAGI
jgi:hypothetical protein